MNRLIAAATGIFMLALGVAHADSLLSEQQARAKASDILKGDPYGRNSAEVAKNIKQVQLVQNGPYQGVRQQEGAGLGIPRYRRDAEQRPIQQRGY
jgi:hypothetical protein